jgi:DNA-binding CsgD family transcriptional regulator
MITSRAMREADLLPCLRTLPAWYAGDRIVGERAATAIWRRLLVSPAFLSGVVIGASPRGAERILGCGASVAVSAEWMNREWADPRPNLNSRLFAAVEAGEPVLLDRDQIARANAGGGVDFVLLATLQWSPALGIAPLEMLSISSKTFMTAHAGFRLRRLLAEAPAALAKLWEPAGIWKTLARFPELEDRSIVGMSSEEAQAVPASIAHLLHRYQAPRLGLRDGEQRVLLAAISGSTDAELARTLGLSLRAVKKHWLAIFARADEALPNLLAHGGAEGLGKRGPQKRHRVLAYVREHPEELRPYAPPERESVRLPAS